MRIAGRIAALVLAASAVACFFLPLFSLHVPVKRDRTFRGLDLATEAFRVASEVRSDAESARRDAEREASARVESKTPASVRLSGLLGVYLLGAAATAVIAAASALRAPRVAASAGVLGATLSVAAIAHLAWLNWQVHGLFAGAPGNGAGAFARLGRRIAGHFAQRFEARPEVGLWAMAGLLVTAAAFSMALRRDAPPDRPAT
jgi:hypothetical protein